VLVIGADGKCKWDLQSKSANPAPVVCTLAANSVTISTGPGSTVEMQHKGGKLEGTFQPRSGRSYNIAMTKQ
jgi:hypothetical protein